MWCHTEIFQWNYIRLIEKKKPSCKHLILVLESEIQKGSAPFETYFVQHVQQSYKQKSITDKGQVFLVMGPTCLFVTWKILTLLLLLYCYHSFQPHELIRSSGFFSGYIESHSRIYMKKMQRAGWEKVGTGKRYISRPVTEWCSENTEFCYIILTIK